MSREHVDHRHIVAFADEWVNLMSDLTQRFLPALVLDAYSDNASTLERATRIAMAIQPTPVFGTTVAPRGH